jgi:hypothetical protein
MMMTVVDLKTHHHGPSRRGDVPNFQNRSAPSNAVRRVPFLRAGCTQSAPLAHGRRCIDIVRIVLLSAGQIEQSSWSRPASYILITVQRLDQRARHISYIAHMNGSTYLYRVLHSTPPSQTLAQTLLAHSPFFVADERWTHFSTPGRTFLLLAFVLSRFLGFDLGKASLPRSFEIGSAGLHRCQTGGYLGRLLRIRSQTGSWVRRWPICPATAVRVSVPSPVGLIVVVS